MYEVSFPLLKNNAHTTAFAHATMKSIVMYDYAKLKLRSI
jgi:hypothetical protein